METRDNLYCISVNNSGLLYKRILKGNKRGNDVFNMLLKGMRKHSFGTYEQDKMYIENEINILKYMICFIKDFQLKDMDENTALIIMRKEKEERIKMLNDVNKHEKAKIALDSTVEKEISGFEEQLQKRIQKQLQNKNEYWRNHV